MMLNALLLSLGQLGDRRILAVLAKSLGLTLLVLVMVGAGLVWGAQALAGSWLAADGAIVTLAGAAAALLAVLGAWLLFRVVAILVIGLFADEVVHAVEAKHYPARFAAGRNLSFARSASMGLRSAARALLVNLLLAPVYLLLLITGVGTALAFFLVNSWLLGRDLGDMVAVRHLPASDLKRWRGDTRIWRFTLGAAGTALFFVPIANFLAPILGAAMATHLFHRRSEP
jgi:uncharacterized protein involved in cysteine biosynthesis